ncbi:MAG: PIN domain-containing protein [Chloroflexi bacterium]|nr:PIN domain-containing protein [Chloroflexota bacterium]
MYVESNFVLELAFLQEEYESCQDVLLLAESGEVDLVIPVFSVAEPYEAWFRRAKHRDELHDLLAAEIRELSRSKPYSNLLQESNDITALLTSSGIEEKQRLDEVLSQILEVAEVITIRASTMKPAIEYQQSLKLSPQDSIVYASVLDHLSAIGSGPKCFLNRNSRDFNDPDIQDELARYECRLIPRFEQGLGFIKARLG